MTTPASPKEERPPKEVGLFSFFFFFSFLLLFIFSALVPIEFYRGYALELPWVACILTPAYQSYSPFEVLYCGRLTIPYRGSRRSHPLFISPAGAARLLFLYLARPRSFSCLSLLPPPSLLLLLLLNPPSSLLPLASPLLLSLLALSSLSSSSLQFQPVTATATASCSMST